MADAVPVSKKDPKVKHTPVYKAPEGEKPEAFKARVDAAVAAEVPAEITDAQVNGIGQAKMYGKVKEADVVAYDIHNKDGEVVRSGTILRVTH